MNKKVTGAAIIILTMMMAAVIYYYPRSTPSAAETPDVSMSAVRLAKKDESGSQLAWAVAYSASTEFVQFLTVAHAVNTSAPSGLVLRFNSGTVVPVLRVRIASEGVDLAMIYVAKSQLNEGVDYVIFDKSLVDTSDEGKPVRLLAEDIYGENGTFHISSIARQGNARYIYIPGRVDKGRSGTPIFLSGEANIIGIVQGYYSPTEGSGEMIRAISIFQAERLFP